MYHDMEVWRTAAIVTAAVSQTLFVALYMTFPWWKTFLGRALFAKATAFALLLDVAVIGRIWDWSWEGLSFVVLYCVLALGVIYQLVAFLRLRRVRFRRDREDSR